MASEIRMTRKPFKEARTVASLDAHDLVWPLAMLHPEKHFAIRLRRPAGKKVVSRH